MQNIRPVNVEVADWETIELHHLCSAFPQMQEDEYDELVNSMESQGFMTSDPIILIGDELNDKWWILDGQNRRQAAMDAGVEPIFEEYRGDNPVEFVMARNMSRRHLSAGQKAAIASKFANLSKGDNQFADGMTQKEAAQKVGVGEASIRRFKKLEQDDPELADAVAAGDMSLEQARKETRPPVSVDQQIDTAGAAIATPAKEDLSKAALDAIFVDGTTKRVMEKYELYGVPTRNAIEAAIIATMER